MNLRFKNILYTLGLISAMYLVWNYRENNRKVSVAFDGHTMGTTYHIKYFDDNQRNFHTEIDSLLKVFNQSLSTYIPTSEISQFNQDTIFNFQLPFFKKVIDRSQEIATLTGGAFDPTVMPLVNAWGFGPEEQVSVDSSYIDSLRTFVGFHKVFSRDNKKVWKLDNRATLDFSAVAKGYGVDVVFDFIEKKGITNLFVEIGGEVRCQGKNLLTDNPWRIAIIHPESDISSPTFIAQLEPGDRGIATSANNFNYRIINGIKYSHTISPFTGFPIKQALLSATVVTPDCMTADALATSFMVMGHTKAIEIIEQNDNIEAFLIYSKNDSTLGYYISKQMESKIKILN